MKLKTPVRDVDYVFRFLNKKTNTMTDYRWRYDGEDEKGRLRFFNVETGTSRSISKKRASYILTYNLVKTIPVPVKTTAAPVQAQSPVRVPVVPSKKELSPEEVEADINKIADKLSALSPEQKTIALEIKGVDVDELIKGLRAEAKTPAEESDSGYFGKLMGQYLSISTLFKERDYGRKDRAAFKRLSKPLPPSNRPGTVGRQLAVELAQHKGQT